MMIHMVPEAKEMATHGLNPGQCVIGGLWVIKTELLGFNPEVHYLQRALASKSLNEGQKRNGFRRFLSKLVMPLIGSDPRG